MTEEQAKLVGRTFRHFKGNLYRLEGFAKDSETLEEMVVYRADASDERPGAGIGIPLVFSTVTLYGGTFDCDSAPGKGTTITVTLPFDMTPRKRIIRRFWKGHNNEED